MFNRQDQSGRFETRVSQHQLESLEPRVLLTTLVGGDIFEYIDSQGQTVRVVVEGDAIIELIGGDINSSLMPDYNDPSNVLVLGDLPGYIYQSDLGREGAIAGGLGGGDGVELRGLIKLTGSTLGPGGNFQGPADGLNIQALATHPDTGNTWAINLASFIPTGGTQNITIAQVIEFDAETGTGHIREELSLTGGLTNTQGIVAAAFDIRPGREDFLYFVTERADNGGYHLQAVDVTDGTLVGPPKTLVGSTAMADGQEVRAIAFDQTGPNPEDYRLVIATLGKVAGPDDGELVDAIILKQTGSDENFLQGGNLETIKAVSFKGEYVTDIGGIGFKGDNAAEPDQFLYATTPSGLLAIDLSTGFARDMGGLVDPDDLRDTPRGGDIGDITWDANSVNPFTGQVGVFVGVDSTTDELIYIDDRPRFATADLFAIYVAQTSENARISIGVVPAFNPEEPDAERNMMPYDGSIGSLRVFDIADEDPLADTIIITAPAATGGVLIGARTEEISPDIDDEEFRAIVVAALEQAIGVRAAGLNTLAGDPDHNLGAGIYVAPSVVEYVADTGSWASRLIGSNVDNVTSLAVNRFGAVYALDTDLSDSDGQLIGDQIFKLNPATGKVQAGGTLTINDGVDDLTGTQAIAFGFADLTDINDETDEELYAIINNAFGIIDTTTGVFTELTADLTAVGGGVLGPLASVRSMAFGTGGTGNQQSLYILVDPNATDGVNETQLYRLDYGMAAGAITGITGVTAVGGIHEVDLGVMTFDASGRLLVQDRDNARYVQMILTSTTVSGVTYDPGDIFILDESPSGSLRSTIGGFAYDLKEDRLLVVDNATGQSVIANEAGSIESSALMQIKSGAAGQSIGSILIGGTITGQVYFSGSIDLFYAGWIITGDAGGQPSGTPVYQGNFFAQGDIRNIVTLGSIGTDTLVATGSGDVITFNSGVDFMVQGRLGQIFGNSSGLFRTTAYNLETNVNLTAADFNQHEIEYRAKDSLLGNTVDGPGIAFQNFRLYNGDIFSNNTFETAQIIGTIGSGTSGQPDVVQLSGSLISIPSEQGSGGVEEEDESSQDPVDFYALSLLAGQTIAIRIESVGGAQPIGVYDPEGRLIAAEYNPKFQTTVITADRPGLYRIAVGQVPGMGKIAELDSNYTLIVESTDGTEETGPGTLSLGGINIKEHMHYLSSAGDPAILVGGGDLGGIVVGQTLYYDVGELVSNHSGMAQQVDIQVDDGNFRAMVAGNIGLGGLSKSSGLNAWVAGDLGLVQATTGTLSLPYTFVGGNIQMIDGIDAVSVDLVVNGGIGNIHAGSMPTALINQFNDRSYIEVNADGLGQDGIIDLIDIEGDLGSSLYGGPAIITNGGGNVRYIRVGGDVYQDSFFAGESADPMTGTSVHVVDDSGANLNLKATFDGLLEVVTYGIRGSGGSVVVKVTSNTGIEVTSTTGQNRRPAEISEMVFTAEGNDAIVDADRRTVVSERNPDIIPVNIRITGSSPVDVFSIVGEGIDLISNTSGGELVNITARSVITLYAAGSIGLAKKHNDTEVMSRYILYDDVYPLFNQRNAVLATDFGSIISEQAIGNVIADASFRAPLYNAYLPSGTIGKIHANYGGVDNPDVFEGIVGPIFARADLPLYAVGDIYDICIGEGLAEPGTGYAPKAGIFAEGFIGRITNQGAGSDIRGMIASEVGIDQIILTGGGSFINAQILTFSELEQTSPVSIFSPTYTYTIFGGSYINNVTVTGNGGIIGTTFISDDIGNISVRGGFGIFTSQIKTLASGSIGNIYADGFGLRNVEIGPGVTTNSIIAGQRSDTPLSISSYSPSVRATEFSPSTATIYNDLQTALDSMFLDPAYTYTAGVIYGVYARGTHDLGTVKGYRIEDSTFNYANSVGSITADEDIVGTEVTTGKINTIATGSSRLRGDIIASNFTIAGNINTIAVYGDIDSTDIKANNNGTLNRLTINEVTGQGGGNFLNNSNLTVTGRVNTIDIDGDIDNSNITVLSGTAGKYAVSRFILGGNLFGTLDLYDNVNKLAIAGSLGNPGDQLIVHGDLRSLIVGSDRKLNGVEMGLDLVVLGDLGTLTVNGRITGDVTVNGNLQRVTATADPTQVGMAMITGNISVTESIRSVTVRGGHVTGDIFAGRDLSSVSITDGDFLGTAASVYGGIRSFTVSGNLDGVIQAEHGDLSSVRVGGDISSTAQITALSARSITASGVIEGGAAIHIDRVLSTLTAGYIGDSITAVDIVAGGVQSITTRGIRGVNDGDLYANLDLGNAGRPGRITVAGNFGGTSIVQGDLSLTVRGDIDMDMAAGEQLLVTGSLTSLSVTGDLSGAIFVRGGGNNWTAGSITNAVITAGSDVRSVTSRGAITDSLIQAGVWTGDDLAWATIDGQQDLGEQARRASIARLTADSVTNSIIAAGGDLTSASIRNAVADSSISSGWSVGSLAIVERLGGQTDGDILREQDGRELLSGSIRTFTAGTLTDSYVTAGVDAGVGGDFSNPTVLLENPNGVRSLIDGGGMSNIGSIRGDTNAGSRILADAGISRDSTDGAAAINGNVTYAIADLEQGSALSPSVGIATQGNDLVYTDNGLTITVSVRGPGSVDLRDISLADNVIDGLVISNTTKATSITITTSVPGAVDIARVFTTDDTELRSFSFDGGIVGDDTANLDAWFDGSIGTLTLGGFGNTAAAQRVTGAIGGDVATFNLGFQQSGILRISGAVRTMNVDAGNGDPLQISQQQYAGRDFTSLTFDNGSVYGVDGNTIYTIDPLNGAAITGQPVTDATLGTGLQIVGMDIDTNTGNVYAVAPVFNQNPTVEIGAITDDLQSLAVRADGAIFAIRYDAAENVDQLVQIDPLTAGITVIGTLQDIFSNTYGTDTGSQVMSLAFHNGQLVALLTDRDGAAGGVASPDDDVTIAALSTTANALGFIRVTHPTGNQALPPVVLATNGGENYTGLVATGGSSLYAIRDGDVIVEINPATGADVATHTFAGLNLTGIGQDIDGNLIGLDTITNQLYVLDLATDTATALANSTVAPGLNAFAIQQANVDGGFLTYAYDDVDDLGVAGDERKLYVNPGMVNTMGIVDPVTGEFTQLRALVQDDQGTPLEGEIVSVSIDSINNRLKVLTDAGSVVTYNLDGTLDTATPVVQLVDRDGQPVTTLLGLDFGADSRVLSVDSQSDRLVVVDLATGLVSALTEPGSIRGDLRAFAFDEITGTGLTFDGSTDTVSSLLGLSQQLLGGITAGSISRLTLGDNYAGRIATQGNLDNITLDGNYFGNIAVGGSVRSLNATDSQFEGRIYAAGDISRTNMRNATMGDAAVLWTDGQLSLTITNTGLGGTTGGTIRAGNLVNLRTNSTDSTGGTIIAANDAGTLNIGSDFHGDLQLAGLSRSLTIAGAQLTGSSIVIDGDAATLNLRSGAEAGTLIAIDGAVRSLTVGETYSGTLGVARGLQRASFNTLNGAIVSAGLDTQSLTVRGDVTNTVISLGTWFGDDHAYNTNDDVITGGAVRSVSITGNYRDSIIALGVLPDFNVGQFDPNTDSFYAFLGNGSYDAAEAGGLLQSNLGSLSIRGEISSSNVGSGRVAGLAVADELGRLNLGQTGNILQQRIFGGDPFGSVDVMALTVLGNTRFELILTEPINSNSAIISIDRDGDNDITLNSPDQYGSLTVRDGDGNVINDIILSIGTRMINGILRGVIIGTTTASIPDHTNLIIDISGSAPQDMEEFLITPELMDRSGLRSAMRSFNGDPFGTILSDFV